MPIIFGVDKKSDFFLKKNKIRKKNGYAAEPGTGPQGEFCKTCKHFYRHQMSKTHFKCSLMRSTWTRGYGTDILANAQACKRWEKPE